MTAIDHTLREIQNDAMEIIALSGDRARQLVPAVVEEILALRDLGVPEQNIDRLIEALRRCCAYNDEFVEHGQSICGHVTMLMHGGEPGALTVRGIVQALRPALRVLRDPASYSAADYVTAARDLQTITRRVPRDKLLSRSVKTNLGGSMYGQLVSVLDGDAAEVVDLVLHRARMAVAS